MTTLVSEPGAVAGDFANLDLWEAAWPKIFNYSAVRFHGPTGQAR